MKRHGALRVAGLATGLLISMIPARAADGLPDRLVDQLLLAVAAPRVDCRAEVASLLRPTVRLDCGAYGQGFKKFKQVWERITGNAGADDVGRWSALTRWSKLGKQLRRRYYWSGEAPLLVLFDLERQHVILARYEVQQACRERARQRGIDEPQSGASAPQRTHYEAPRFPEKGRIAGLSAVVLLWFVVDERGEVKALCLVAAKPSGYGFELAAMEAVEQWRYDPAARGGRPVPVEILRRVTFEQSTVPLPYRGLLDPFFLRP